MSRGDTVLITYAALLMHLMYLTLIIIYYKCAYLYSWKLDPNNLELSKK